MPRHLPNRSPLTGKNLRLTPAQARALLGAVARAPKAEGREARALTLAEAKLAEALTAAIMPRPARAKARQPLRAWLGRALLH